MNNEEKILVLLEQHSEMFAQINSRLDKMDERLNRMDSRLDKMDERLIGWRNTPRSPETASTSCWTGQRLAARLTACRSPRSVSNKTE